MHPEIARSVAEQHMAELRRQARLHRLVGCQHSGGRHSATTGRLAAVRLAVRRLLAVRLAGARRDREHGAAGREIVQPGVFLAGPEAFGLRTYLTADEARQLAADWAGLLSRFSDRAEDPSRRPAGAVPFELVVLGRQVPDLAGASGGPTGRG